MSEAAKGIAALLDGIMPPDRMAAYREESRKQDEREAKMISNIRRECLDAMQLLVDASRNPRISRQDISDAIATLHKALAWAQELDK